MSNTRSQIKKINCANSNLPRLVVFRSNLNIYAQVIDNDGKVIAAASSLKFKKDKLTVMAAEVGKKIAELSKKASVDKVVFDRSVYRYHGAVKVLAESAKESGLKI